MITPGSHVVLRDADAVQKVFQVNYGKDLRMGKYPPIPAEAVLAVPYGTILRRMEGDWARHWHSSVEAMSSVAMEAAEDNQHLAQDNSAQALSPAEVHKLKGELTGEEVIEALASNSTTFA